MPSDQAAATGGGRRRAYITMLGRTVWALANAYHAALMERGFLPERIWIFTEERYRVPLDKAVSAVTLLSESFGISPKVETCIVEEADFLCAGMKVSAMVKRLKAEGYEVALDVTPGRKPLVAGALVALASVPIDHVFYLGISKLEGASKPYLMIPFQQQRLHDFLEAARRGDECR